MFENVKRLLIAACCLVGATAHSQDRNPAPPMHVVLIGASIGQDWNLPAYPQRMHDARFQFEALQAWQFDKSETLDETLMRPARKFHASLGYLKGFFQPAPIPADLIILKECSSYFPSEMDKNRALVEQWVHDIRAKNKPVMIATSVPVTRERARRDPGKQEGVRAFNDWVRVYAARERLPLLDLEAALRTDDTDRFLRDDLTSGDGSHLNAAAYAILDQVLAGALCRFDARGPCAQQTATAR